MWPAIFIILLLIVGVLVLLLMVLCARGRFNGEISSPDESKIATAIPEHSLEEETSVDTLGFLPPEDEILGKHRHKIFQDRIKEGIKRILPDSPVMNSDRRIPLKADDVHPKIMKFVLSNVSELRDLGATYEVYKALDDPNVSMSKLTEIVVTDPVLSGKVLEIANSAYFGLQKRVDSIGHAIVILGLNNLRALIYHEKFYKVLDITSSVTNYTVEALWEHVTITSICSSYVSSLFNGLNRGTLFTMGLLHDVGKFVIANLPAISAANRDLDSSFPEVSGVCDEDEFFGINHAIIGKLALQQWKLTELMIRMVEVHHLPSFFDKYKLVALYNDIDLEYLIALFLGNQIAKLFAEMENDIFLVAPLNPSYYDMIDRKRLEGLILDTSLYSEIKKAKALLKNYS